MLKDKVCQLIDLVNTTRNGQSTQNISTLKIFTYCILCTYIYKTMLTYTYAILYIRIDSGPTSIVKLNILLNEVRRLREEVNKQKSSKHCYETNY